MYRYSIPHILQHFYRKYPGSKDYDQVLSETKKRLEDLSMLKRGDVFMDGEGNRTIFWVMSWDQEYIRVIFSVESKDFKLKHIKITAKDFHKLCFDRDFNFINKDYWGNNPQIANQIEAAYLNQHP